MVGNLVLRRRVSEVVKRDFRISDDIPPQMKLLNMVIPILMYFYSYVSERRTPHKANEMWRHVKQFPAVYRKIYCPNF